MLDSMTDDELRLTRRNIAEHRDSYPKGSLIRDALGKLLIELDIELSRRRDEEAARVELLHAAGEEGF